MSKGRQEAPVETTPEVPFLLRALPSGIIVVAFLLFGLLYHLVFLSDDIFSVRVLRKEHLTFSGTILNVQEFVIEYNSATASQRREIESTYLYRRLVETGLVDVEDE